MQGGAGHLGDVLTGDGKGDLDPFRCLPAALVDHAEQGAGDPLLHRLRGHLGQRFCISLRAVW